MLAVQQPDKRAGLDDTYSAREQQSRPFSQQDSQRAMKIVAVVPAYNEERFIGSVVLKTLKFADEVLVIDDGSCDATVEIARAAGALVISHQQNQGKGGGGGMGFPFPFGDPGGGGEESGDGREASREKVKIPGAEAYKVPEEFRKDLLDAMRQGAPERYKGEVQHYYEELVK